jgi:hypothetical protein
MASVVIQISLETKKVNNCPKYIYDKIHINKEYKAKRIGSESK